MQRADIERFVQCFCLECVGTDETFHPDAAALLLRNWLNDDWE